MMLAYCSIHPKQFFMDVLGIKRAATKILPKQLNFEQQQLRMNIAWEMLTTFNDYPDLLKKAITDDKSWVYGYDIETSSQYKRPRPKSSIVV